MQTHLKERLTGAALLVVIVVLLVPEMFRGRPASAPQSTSVAPEGPPVRSYTIDLRDNGVAQPLPAGTPLSAGTAPPNTAPSTGVSATAAPTVVASTPAAPAPAVTPVQVVPAPAASKPSASTPSVAAKAAPAPASAAAHGAAHARWTVQVGSYARRDFAERMVKQMKAKGFAVQVAGPDDRGLYRVRSALFAERASAMALREQMQQKGLKPIVNTLP